MHSDLTSAEAYLGKLQVEMDQKTLSPRPRVVLTGDGTKREDPYKTSPDARQFGQGSSPVGGAGQVGEADKSLSGGSAGSAVTPDIDGLFGDSLPYQAYKREKPEHRLMLWYRLQGYNVKETARLLGYTPQSVSQICKQPWFREAFTRLAASQGKEAISVAIESEVLPAFERLVTLAESATSEAVQLAANQQILDRFLGKPTVKVESKTSSTVTNIVASAQSLLDENRRLEEELAARGIRNGTN